MMVLRTNRANNYLLPTTQVAETGFDTNICRNTIVANCNFPRWVWWEFSRSYAVLLQEPNSHPSRDVKPKLHTRAKNALMTTIILIVNGLFKFILFRKLCIFPSIQCKMIFHTDFPLFA